MSATNTANREALALVQDERPADLADLIVEYLCELNVEFVFGVPGGAIEPFYNAIARSQRRGGLRSIEARHEAGAAFMADAYARETRRIGVCCATTGPGATNLITGVASAYADRVPLLVITAQTSLPKFGRNALQDSSCAAINTVGMFEHCTRYNTLVSHSEQLEPKLIAALMTCMREPTGPAHISIPSDVLTTPRIGAGKVVLPSAIKRVAALMDREALDQLCLAIAGAKRIVVYLGDGAGEAIDLIKQFAELTNAAIITGPMGKRWVDAFHPLYYGVFGFAGHKSARQALEHPDVDLILAVGSSLGELSTGGWDRLLLNSKLIHIDSTVEHFTRSPMARLHVCGRLKTIFDTLNERVMEVRHWGRTWGEDLLQGLNSAGEEELGFHGSRIRLNQPELCYSEAVPLKPQRLMYELSRRLPDEARILTDAGNAWCWTTHYLHRPSMRGNYRIALGFGSMGWGIAGAVGTALACKAPVFCITGDGSYLMSAQEITVAVQHGLPVIYIVLNDQAYGMVKHGQRMGGAEPIAYQLPLVDFAALGRAVGARGYTVKTPEDLMAIDFNALAEHPGPSIIDVYIDPEEAPPMGDRVKGLKTKTPGQ
ncbi:MAG: thiamine pyrophosphate-binding protein [Gammaproteobacteria bacterium]|nr:thiamine pyrophosphate-binding protein [Gammaproteobacteria bacterium]